jgi:hypothetical protein
MEIIDVCCCFGWKLIGYGILVNLPTRSQGGVIGERERKKIKYF